MSLVAQLVLLLCVCFFFHSSSDTYVRSALFPFQGSMHDFVVHSLRHRKRKMRTQKKSIWNSQNLYSICCAKINKKRAYICCDDGDEEEAWSIWMPLKLSHYANILLLLLPFFHVGAFTSDSFNSNFSSALCKNNWWQQWWEARCECIWQQERLPATHFKEMPVYEENWLRTKNDNYPVFAFATIPQKWCSQSPRIANCNIWCGGTTFNVNIVIEWKVRANRKPIRL